MKIKFRKDTWLVEHTCGGFAGESHHKAVKIKGGEWIKIEDIKGLNIHVKGKFGLMDGYFTYFLNVPESLYKVKNE